MTPMAIPARAPVEREPELAAVEEEPVSVEPFEDNDPELALAADEVVTAEEAVAAEDFVRVRSVVAARGLAAAAEVTTGAASLVEPEVDAITDSTARYIELVKEYFKIQ